MAKKHRKIKRVKPIREDQYLPYEIWFQILARVPVKALLRFRSVSKTWCSMIDSPDFASQQFNLCKTNSANTHLLVFERSSKWGDKGCIFRRSDNFRKTYQYDFDICRDGSFFEVEDYIHGVFLMHTPGKLSNLMVVLWNPSIRKSVNIPPPPILSKLTTKMKVEFCLGFDPMKQDYKVLVITYHKVGNNLSQIRVSIELYSLNTGSWRVISGEDYPFWCAKEKSCLEGFIYTTGFEMQGLTNPPLYDTHLVIFDVCREVFDAIRLPNVENPHELLGRTVVLTNGAVGLFDYGTNCSIVWGLGKNRGGWSKLYTIDSTLDGLFYDSRKGLFYLENNLLFFEGEGGKLRSYEIETKRLKLLSKSFAFETILFMDAYVESLALLANKTSITSPRDDDGKE